jgi:hypothetical protein
MAGKNSTEEVIFNFTYSDIPFVIICITGIASNLLLLIGFAKDPLKCFRNSATYLVMNLSVTDCLISLLGLVLRNITVPRLNVEFFYLWITSTSFGSILAVSIDRFVLVAYPIKHRILVDGKVICLWIAAVWIVGLILPLLKLIYGLAWADIKFNNFGTVMVVIILSAFLYACTYGKLKKQSRNIALENSNERRAQQLRLLKEKQFLKTIILIACIAFFCTVPTMVYFQIFYSLAVEDYLVTKIFFKFFLCLYHLNFAANPLIYVIRLPNYQKTFRILYSKRMCSSMASD